MSISEPVPPVSLRPGLNRSVSEIRAHLLRTGTPSYTGKGVIVGVVDSGIDVFHRCFRKVDSDRKTRILWIWDQRLPLTAGLQGPPAGFTGGVEFSRDKIDAALHGDPDAFPHKDESGHGTWVAGIAAGNGAQAGRCHFANTYIGVAPDADIIVAKALSQGPGNNFFTTANDIVEAVKYIFAKAAGQPVVVNISLGGHASNTYGRGDLDTKLDALLAGTTRRAIVTIPGNLASGRDHFYGEIPPHGTLERRFFNIPGMAPPVAHLHRSAGADLELTLSSKAHTFDPMPVTSSSVTLSPPDQDRVTLTPDGTDHHVLTTSAGGPGRMVTPGKWTITVHERAGAAASVSLWAESNSMRVFYGPDESHVEPVDPAGRKALADDQTRTMVEPGTAANVITVGAHDISSGALAEFPDAALRGCPASGIRQT
jgi:hypothetical protein